MRRVALLAAVVLGGCGGGVDGSLRPEDIWIRPPPPAAPALPDGVRVRAVTLNLHGGMDAPVERVIATLAPLDLDVVGLEECPAAYATALAEGLGTRHRVGDEGNVLLSRFAVTATRAVSLVAGRGFVRALVFIEDVPISVYVAHIGWNAEGSRQARELLEQHLMPDPFERILLMGDFNDEHLSPQASILEILMEDAFTATGVWPGQRISWPATGFDGSEGSQLIDLHYYRKAEPAIVLQADILNVIPPISDHKPSFVELLYRRQTGASFAGMDPFVGRRQPWAVVTRDPAANRLANPGAEEGSAGWTADNGGEIVEGAREHQPPHDGLRQFTGASDGFMREDPVSGWTQSVDLAGDAAVIDGGRGWLEIAGWMAVGYRQSIDGDVVASSPRPYDEGEVLVELLDAAGALRSRWSSGRRDPLQHHPFGARVAIPPGARRAVVRLASHLKESSGPSHDAVFDDLYLAVRAGEGHDVRGERARVDGEAAGAWGSWARLRDGEPIGIMIYPPRSRSGRGLLVGGAAMPGPVAGAQSAAVEPGLLAFSAWARTMAGRGAVTLSLDLYEEDAEEAWGTFTLDPVQAAEWTRVEGVVRVPVGIDRAVVRVSGDAASDLVFLDDVVLEAR